LTREEELARDGWKKQVTLDEPRLSDVVEMYAEIDFEIHLEPFHPEEEAGCTECMRNAPENFKTIYTRKKS
jgi:hypothetical protein